MRISFVLPVLVLLLTCGSAAAQDDEAPSETIGRWLGGTNEAVQAFGKSQNLLVPLTAKSFVGSGPGSTKRALAKSWNAIGQGLRGTADATKNSLPYSVAPTVFNISDFATSVVAPAIEGDGKGAVSGAVNVGVSSIVATQGATAGAQLFGAIGGTVGSFIPVVGTAAGAMVGGAIGTVAGGFIASIAYDRYGKSIVGKIIEGGLSAVFDPDPMLQAIAAREDFLRKQAAPELQANWDYNVSVGQSYGQEEEQLFKPLTGVYTPKIAPAPGDLAVDWNSVKLIELVFWTDPNFKVHLQCDVAPGVLNCTGHERYPGAREELSLTGTISGNAIAFKEHITLVYASGECDSSYDIHTNSRHTLLPGGQEKFHMLGGTGRWLYFRGKCGRTDLIPVETKIPQIDGVGTWRVIK